jgi:hypothetical protein
MFGITVEGSALRQEVLLALLAKEPAQGFQLRARLNEALGSLGEQMNDGRLVSLGLRPGANP